VPALFQEGLAVDAVEGVGEIDFDEDGARVGAVTVAPLPGHLVSYFCAEGLRDSELEWEEVFLRLGFGGKAQALGSEAAECFTDCYGSHPIVFFGKCHQGGTSEVRRHFGGRLAAGQESDQRSQVLQDLVAVTWGESLL